MEALELLVDRGDFLVNVLDYANLVEYFCKEHNQLAAQLRRKAEQQHNPRDEELRDKAECEQNEQKCCVVATHNEAEIQENCHDVDECEHNLIHHKFLNQTRRRVAYAYAHRVQKVDLHRLTACRRRRDRAPEKTHKRDLYRVEKAEIPVVVLDENIDNNSFEKHKQKLRDNRGRYPVPYNVNIRVQKVVQTVFAEYEVEHDTYAEPDDKAVKNKLRSDFKLTHNTSQIFETMPSKIGTLLSLSIIINTNGRLSLTSFFASILLESE